jgi:hypothetical protein
VLQAVGGGISASNNRSLLDAGNAIIITGIAFQVATMFVCICLAADFGLAALRSRKEKTSADVYSSEQSYEVKGGRRWFKFSCVSLASAFIAIFIRCVYR